MGIATDNSPAAYGGMASYGRWEIDVRLFDSAMQEIDKFTCRQDLWISEKQFALRLTRQDDPSSPYEDRGDVDQGHRIKGVSGFGGVLGGALTENNGVFLEGTGGSADFILVATQTGEKHFRCFRRFIAHQSGKIWGTEVTAGTYFATTEDQLLETSIEPPAEMRQALGS